MSYLLQRSYGRGRSRSVLHVLLMSMLAVLGFHRCVHAYDNGAPGSRLPVLGWSSWVGLGPLGEHPVFDYCDEASVKQAVDAFVDLGFKEVGYTGFHLDDCWADKERNASGFLQGERDHFPNGMKPVVDYVHDKGLDFGLYTCAGTETCVGGRPGSKDHWVKDAQVFAEWGVDWVKQDNCNTDGMGHPKDYFKLMSQALNETNRPICFAMCEWGVENPWEWGDAIAQSWRATGDHVGTWASTKDIIRQSAAVPAEFSGRPYGWNDLDMLETGNYDQAAHANGKAGNMTAIEARTEFSMWAISASPLVVTTPIMNCTKTADEDVKCVPWISDLQREILFNTDVIAVNQQTTPQGRPLKDGDLTIWTRDLENGDVAVALYNEDDDATKLSFVARDIGAGHVSCVRDLWAHADVSDLYDAKSGVFGPVNVEAHESKMYRVVVGDGMSC